MFWGQRLRVTQTVILDLVHKMRVVTSTVCICFWIRISTPMFKNRASTIKCKNQVGCGTKCQIVLDWKHLPWIPASESYLKRWMFCPFQEHIETSILQLQLNYKETSAELQRLRHKTCSQCQTVARVCIAPGHWWNNDLLLCLLTLALVCCWWNSSFFKDTTSISAFSVH